MSPLIYSTEAEKVLELQCKNRNETAIHCMSPYVADDTAHEKPYNKLHKYNKKEKKTKANNEQKQVNI